MRSREVTLLTSVVLLASSSWASAQTPLQAELAFDAAKKAPATLADVNLKCTEPGHATQPYCRLQCQYANIICIDTKGAPIPSETLPASLDPRTTIQLYIVSTSTDTTTPTIRITEVVKKDSAEKLKVKPSEDRAAWRDLQGGWRAWGTSFTMASDAESERIELYTMANDDEQKLSSFIVRSNGGYFYYTFGPMLAIPFAGTQKIISAQPPDGTTDRYTRVRDTDILPAFAVHIYPGGHRAESSTPLEQIALTRQGVKSFVRDAFSIEAAVSINPKEVFDHLFIGGAFEPITGFTTSVGFNINRGERYRNGYQDGAFPAASRDSAVEEFASVSGYVGFGLNQKIFSTIVNAFNSPSGSQDAGPK